METSSIPASAQASTGLDLERSRAAFPLTLTLSRGERETPNRRLKW